MDSLSSSTEAPGVSCRARANNSCVAACAGETKYAQGTERSLKHRERNATRGWHSPAVATSGNRCSALELRAVTPCSCPEAVPLATSDLLDQLNNLVTLALSILCVTEHASFSQLLCDAPEQVTHEVRTRQHLQALMTGTIRLLFNLFALRMLQPAVLSR